MPRNWRQYDMQAISAGCNRMYYAPIRRHHGKMTLQLAISYPWPRIDRKRGPWVHVILTRASRRACSERTACFTGGRPTHGSVLRAISGFVRSGVVDGRSLNRRPKALLDDSSWSAASTPNLRQANVALSKPWAWLSLWSQLAQSTRNY
jgi:hypothetical protein